MANTQPGSASARDLPVAALHEVPGRKLNDEDIWVREDPSPCFLYADASGHWHFSVIEPWTSPGFKSAATVLFDHRCAFDLSMIIADLVYLRT